MSNIEQIMVTCAAAILMKLAPERLSKGPVAAKADGTPAKRGGKQPVLMADAPNGNGNRTPRANPVMYRMVSGWDKKTANTVLARGGNNGAALALVKDAGKTGITARDIMAKKSKSYPDGMKPKAVQSALHALRTIGIVESVRQ